MPRVKKEISGDSLDRNSKLQEKIIENLVELQKVQTNMAEKFDNLSNQISGLLNLFENAARSFAEHPANIATEKDREFLNKIDKLLEQNKTIAKGLTLMEDRIKERVYGGVNNESQTVSEEGPKSTYPLGRPLPKF